MSSSMLRTHGGGICRRYCIIGSNTIATSTQTAISEEMNEMEQRLFMMWRETRVEGEVLAIRGLNSMRRKNTKAPSGAMRPGT